MPAFSAVYAGLPQPFRAEALPSQPEAPLLITVNEALAAELGFDLARIEPADLTALFSGAAVPHDARPVAIAYAGHQFGSFVPQLGDGRALLIGEVRDRAGNLRDIQLKGSGPTPFSRRGDGRAALGPVLREYIVSEAMHALGIPATRALAAALTGDVVYRETVLPGAIVTRVAASHIRVGTFQYLAARGDEEGLRILADHVIARHYPDLSEQDAPYPALLAAIVERQARLVARWMQVGFIHGVMNTDNMTVSGETIDFGPCAFLDAYQATKVFSSIDQQGRYAYRNQPGLAQWNLARLAEAMLPLIDADTDKAIEIANGIVVGFAGQFQTAWLAGMRAKMGLFDAPEDGDLDLVQRLLSTMEAGEADFTRTFRALCAAAIDPAADAVVRAEFADPMAFDAWAIDWRNRLAADRRGAGERLAAMRAINPAFIPRNHRIEEAIVAAVERRDFAPFERLVAVLARPYEDQPEHADLTLAPQPDERVARTFCGT
ncbi:protein adenylyltransferase SelO [Rhizobium sp. RU20A]|uniref:protein adenylyltransferase SelO n=1 Tax=Rhizobium sp. RU20A TaxID=1907412 RepID=UPI00165F2990|nr:YdiU family protein [Rhizobium sp. RU20A]